MVERGWLLPRDGYIPANAVNADTITLSYTKQELQDHDWTTLPEQTATSTSTNANTATAATSTQATATDRTTNTTDAADIRVPLREEEFVVGKQQQEEGLVHLHKDVVTEQVTIEHILAAQFREDDVRATDDIIIPVMEERLVVRKEQVITEYIRIHKETVTQQQEVRDSVRREILMINQEHLDENTAALPLVRVQT